MHIFTGTSCCRFVSKIVSINVYSTININCAAFTGGPQTLIAGKNIYHAIIGFNINRCLSVCAVFCVNSSSIASFFRIGISCANQYISVCRSNINIAVFKSNNTIIAALYNNIISCIYNRISFIISIF